MSEARTLYFTMVRHPVDGWTRVGNAYASRRRASDWLSFVRNFWGGCRVRVSQCTLRWIDGQLDERSVRVLDQKFNLDAPSVAEALDAAAPEEQR